MPLILSTDLSRRRDDFKRTATTIINAYLHRDMVKYLYRGDEELRRAWFERPLLITHSSGGTARVAKTTALNTYNSGPAAGMLGSALIARLYGLPNLISTDMGGTSLDIGFIVDGAYGYEIEPTVEGIPVYLPMIEVATIGAGGGSIAWVDPATSDVEVGTAECRRPARPGGLRPGRDGADRHRRRHRPGLHRPRQLPGRRHEAEPRQGRAGHRRPHRRRRLDLTVEEAALHIKQKVDGNIGARIAHEIGARGKQAADFALLAYGGAGATHCCGYAEALGVERIITFPYSAVFSAFGSSTADVVHTYTHTEPTAVYTKAEGSRRSRASPVSTPSSRSCGPRPSTTSAARASPPTR